MYHGGLIKFDVSFLELKLEGNFNQRNGNLLEHIIFNKKISKKPKYSIKSKITLKCLDDNDKTSVSILLIR